LLINTWGETYLSLDLTPYVGLVTDDTLDSPPCAIPHFLSTVNGPDAEALSTGETFLSELFTFGRSEILVSNGETVDVLEEMLSGFRNRHCNGESREEG
jgi:hypothetical protein